jgi:hypothetical protein
VESLLLMGLLMATFLVAEAVEAVSKRNVKRKSASRSVESSRPERGKVKERKGEDEPDDGLTTTSYDPAIFLSFSVSFLTSDFLTRTAEPVVSFLQRLPPLLVLPPLSLFSVLVEGVTRGEGWKWTVAPLEDLVTKEEAVVAGVLGKWAERCQSEGVARWVETGETHASVWGERGAEELLDSELGDSRKESRLMSEALEERTGKRGGSKEAQLTHRCCPFCDRKCRRTSP